jgi:hypothetical protein
VPRWIALLAAGATASAVVASSVPAAARPGATATYHISLSGSQRSVFTRSGTTTDDHGCTIGHADRDVQTITFAASRRAPLRIGARGLPLLRFDLLARVTGSYHRESDSSGSGSDCASGPKTSNRSCGPASLRTGLTVRPRPRLGVWLGGGYLRARDGSRCATTLGPPDTFLQPSETRLTRSPAGARRLFVHGHLVLRTTERDTTKNTIVDWRLTLTRV